MCIGFQGDTHSANYIIYIKAIHGHRYNILMQQTKVVAINTQTMDLLKLTQNDRPPKHCQLIK